MSKRLKIDLTDPRIAHTVRFRRVSTRYPHMVTEAYGGGLARAMADSDEQVAAIVAEWEMQTRGSARDWAAIGRDEGQHEVDEELVAGWRAWCSARWFSARRAFHRRGGLRR